MTGAMQPRSARHQHSPQIRIPRDVYDAAERRAVELTIETGEPVGTLAVLRSGARVGVSRVTAADLP